MKVAMRTGTKFAGLLVLWAVLLISGFLTWLIVNAKDPKISQLWQYAAGIIAAILGPAGINLSVNEVRKALENGGIQLLKKQNKKAEDGDENK
jgi:cobalamin biosynthesis protein CobD/CbiB